MVLFEVVDETLMLSESWGACMPIRKSVTNEVEWDNRYCVVRRAPFGLVCRHHHHPRCYYEHDFLLVDMMWWYDMSLPTFVSVIAKEELRREAGCSVPGQQNLENIFKSYPWVWINLKIKGIMRGTHRCMYTHVTQKTEDNLLHYIENKTCGRQKLKEALQGFSGYTQTRNYLQISTLTHPILYGRNSIMSL